VVQQYFAPAGEISQTRDTLKDVYSEGNSVLSQSDYTAISHSLKSRNVKLVVEAILKADSFHKYTVHTRWFSNISLPLVKYHRHSPTIFSKNDFI
jgi:hypothetical protein